MADVAAAEEHVLNGNRLRDAGEYAAAAAAYASALALAPAWTDIRVQFGNMLKDTGHLPEAESTYRAALVQAPEEADIHLQLGHVLKLQDRLAEAAAAYRTAANIQPSNESAWSEVAEAYAKLGYSDDADASLRTATSWLTDTPERGLRLAETAVRCERWHAAAFIWRVLRQKFPNEPLGYLSGAEALERVGQPAEATKVLRLATRHFSGSEAAWLAKIRLALLRRDLTRALREWHTFLQVFRTPTEIFISERKTLRKRLAALNFGFAAVDDDADLLPGAVICEDPVIILCSGELFEIVEKLAPFYLDRTVYVFMSMLWTISQDHHYRQKYRDAYSRVTRLHQNFKITVLANDVAELLCLRDLGIPGELVNHNAFIDSNIFNIMQIEQPFDAVYNSRILPHKRHYLAKGIKNLKLVIYDANQQNALEAQRLVPGCTIANQRGDDIAHSVTAHEVAYHLNTAKCGLCLSEIEGAMFSSAEYLLCGLPVVTTHNSGGRNWFFSNDYVIFCEDTEAAVTEAVGTIIKKNISRQLIRASILEKIKRDRLVFFELVNRVFHELGQESRRIEPEFHMWFYDTGASLSRTFWCLDRSG